MLLRPAVGKLSLSKRIVRAIKTSRWEAISLQEDRRSVAFMSRVGDDSYRSDEDRRPVAICPVLLIKAIDLNDIVRAIQTSLLGSYRSDEDRRPVA